MTSCAIACSAKANVCGRRWCSRRMKRSTARRPTASPSWPRPSKSFTPTRWCMTGALIAAPCVIGGLSADGTPNHVEALRAYGEAIGLAFQIADDVLDATATSDQLGKTAGKDAAHAKATFVTLLGVGAARVEA